MRGVRRRRREILEERDVALRELGDEDLHLVHVPLVHDARGAVAAHAAQVQVARAAGVDAVRRVQEGPRGDAVDVKRHRAGARRHRDVVPRVARDGARGGRDGGARVGPRRFSRGPKPERVREMRAAARAPRAVSFPAHEHHAPAEVAQHSQRLTANLRVGTNPRLEGELLRVVHRSLSVDADDRVLSVEIHRARALELRRARRRRGRGRRERVEQSLRARAIPQNRRRVVDLDDAVEAMPPEIGQDVPVPERRVELVVRDDLRAIGVIPSRERAVHPRQDVLLADDGAEHAELVHVPEEGRALRASNRVADAERKLTAVVHADVPARVPSGELAVDVKRDQLHHRVDGDRDVVPSAVGDGAIGGGRVSAHVALHRVTEEADGAVDVVAAAQVAAAAAEQIHRPTHVTEHDDRLGLDRLRDRLDPRLDGEVLRGSHERIERHRDVLIDAVEVKRRRSVDRERRSERLQGVVLVRKEGHVARRQVPVVRPRVPVDHDVHLVDGTHGEGVVGDQRVEVRMRRHHLLIEERAESQGVDRVVPQANVVHETLVQHAAGGAFGATGDAGAADDEILNLLVQAPGHVVRGVGKAASLLAVDVEAHLGGLCAARIPLRERRRHRHRDVVPRASRDRGRRRRLERAAFLDVRPKPDGVLDVGPSFAASRLRFAHGAVAHEEHAPTAESRGREESAPAVRVRFDPRLERHRASRDQPRAVRHDHLDVDAVKVNRARRRVGADRGVRLVKRPGASVGEHVRVRDESVRAAVGVGRVHVERVVGD